MTSWMPFLGYFQMFFLLFSLDATPPCFQRWQQAEDLAFADQDFRWGFHRLSACACLHCVELCSSRLQFRPSIHQFPDQVQLVRCWRTLLTCWRFACKEEILAKLACLNLCWMRGEDRYRFLCNWTFRANFGCSSRSLPSWVGRARGFAGSHQQVNFWCEVAAAAKAVYSEAGVSGLWRGAGPTVQRATLLTASQADWTCAWGWSRVAKYEYCNFESGRKQWHCIQTIADWLISHHSTFFLVRWDWLAGAKLWSCEAHASWSRQPWLTLFCGHVLYYPIIQIILHI